MTKALQFMDIYVTYTKQPNGLVHVHYSNGNLQTIDRTTLLDILRTIRQDYLNNPLSLQIYDIIHWLEQD